METQARFQPSGRTVHWLLEFTLCGNTDGIFVEEIIYELLDWLKIQPSLLFIPNSLSFPLSSDATVTVYMYTDIRTNLAGLILELLWRFSTLCLITCS